MKVLGLVLELNPFHNGHKYFIEEAKRLIEPDVTIAVVSSSFSMRGDVMVMDKWTKAKLALSQGIDLVLELPFLGAVNSADYFCYNAIKILTSFKITDLAFGAELADLAKLKQIKDLIKTKVYNITIKEYLDKGFSYSNSSYKAIKAITNDQEIIDNFTLPNNTLAFGYLNSLEKLGEAPSITVIKRINNNYYDEEVNATLINSATSLRNMLAKNETIDRYTPGISYSYFNPEVSKQKLLTLLQYQFTLKDIGEWPNIMGVSEGIEQRFANFIFQAQSYDDFVGFVKTKRYPPNRIKRLILYMLLGVSKEHENQPHHYLRILAMNQVGKNYVNTLPLALKKQIITSFKKLNNDLVNYELKASKLFGIINEKPNIYLQEFQVPYIGEN